MIRLKDGEHIVTAWGEYASGPGWANRPVWVLIENGRGQLRIEALQPHEHGDKLATLFVCSAAMHKTMAEAVRDRVAGEHA